MTEISSFTDLVARLELTDVRIDEVSGRRRGEDDPPPEQQSQLALTQRISEGTLIFEGRLEVYAEQAVLAVALAADFRLTEEIEKPENEILERFAREVGIPAIYPYLRAEVQLLARTLGVPAPILPLYRHSANTAGDPVVA